MGRILFLRNQDNESIVDCSIYRDKNEIHGNWYVELNCTVDIKSYSKLLLGLNEEKQTEAIADFDEIQELRGWLWEKFLFPNNNGTEEQLHATIEEVRTHFADIAAKYGLGVVED